MTYFFLVLQISICFPGLRIFPAARGITQRGRAIPEPATSCPTRFFSRDGVRVQRAVRGLGGIVENGDNGANLSGGAPMLLAGIGDAVNLILRLDQKIQNGSAVFQCLP